MYLGIYIIYKYFTGNVREFYYTKGSQDQFTKHPERSEGLFFGKIGLWNTWLDKIVLNCPKGRKET